MAQARHRPQIADGAEAEAGGARPDTPADLPKRSWPGILKRTAKEFKEDNLTVLEGPPTADRRHAGDGPAAGAVCVAVVVSGPLAQSAGDLVGVGSTAITVWSIAKWPVIALVFMLMLALLYYAAPNVKHPRFRWASPGAIAGVLLWIVGVGSVRLERGMSAEQEPFLPPRDTRKLAD